MAKFLRMKPGGDCPDCFFRKPHHETCPWVLGEYCAYHDCVFVEDTIIPQKLALYDEMIKALTKPLTSFTENTERAIAIKSIIDRAKKIEEAAQ